MFLIGTWSWFSFWLILHILAVIIAFGPTFAFGLIAAFGQKHPQFALAAGEITDLIERRMVIPLAVVVPLLGTALIFSGHFDLWKSEWLLIAIVLYIFNFSFAVFVQDRNSARAVRLMRSMPPGPPPEGAGPPPELAALGKKLQMGGVLLGLIFVAILVLMVWKPGSCQFGVGGC